MVFLQTKRIKNILILLSLIMICVTTSGCITTLLMPFAASTPYLNYQTKTNLQLPIEGEWYVYWGGESVKDNYHAVSSSQRFAVDFIKIEKAAEPAADPIRADQTHVGKGRDVTDYYAFGQKIYAPGKGIIHTVVNNLPDERPGRRRSKQHFGNHVIIDHENGEYSFLAHFKENSIIVKPGDRVNQGDFLGMCGNSGMTTLPHLHFHMQTSPQYHKKKTGIPAYFNNFYVNGFEVERSTLKKGQLVRPTL